MLGAVTCESIYVELTTTTKRRGYQMIRMGRKMVFQRTVEAGLNFEVGSMMLAQNRYFAVLLSEEAQ